MTERDVAAHKESGFSRRLEEFSANMQRVLGELGVKRTFTKPHNTSI